MTPTEIFLWGLGGSLAVDIVAAAQYFNTPTEQFPARYTKVAFYIVRILLAMVGGGLALAYQIDKPLLAANIGAATPLIIQAFAQGLGYIQIPNNGGAASKETPAADPTNG
jgi:hypothetical protein